MDWLNKGGFEIVISQTISYSNCRRIRATEGASGLADQQRMS